MSAKRYAVAEEERSADVDILSEKRQLEQKDPALVSSYESFVKSFAQFREVEKQFVRRPASSRKFSSPSLCRFK
jgi:hypothetical protein